MKHYNLNGAERGCYDCGKQYLQCTCRNKPQAIINETPVFQIGDEVWARITDHCELAKITAIRYPVYTTNTSWNGAPVIVTDYEVTTPDERTEWLSRHYIHTR